MQARQHDRQQQIRLYHEEYKNQVTPKETAESAGENMAFEPPENSSHKELGQHCILWTQQCANTHTQEIRGEEACVSKKEVWINEKMTLGSETHKRCWNNHLAVKGISVKQTNERPTSQNDNSNKN